MPKFRYIRDNKNIFLKSDLTFSRGNPRACLAVEFKDNCILYAVASCHKGDTFYKRIGRTIAEGRLKTSPNVIEGLPKSTFEVLKKIMQDVAISGDVPRNVRRLAEDWLVMAEFETLSK
jgi:hypothetical protein